MSSSTDSAEEFIPLKRFKAGRAFTSKEKDNIYKIYESNLQIHPEALKSEIVRITAQISGVGEASVYRLVKERKERGRFLSPKKTKIRPKVSEKVDDFDKHAITRQIHEFYFRNEMPTVEKVLEVVNSDETLPNFKRSSFYRLLKALNLKCVRRGRTSALLDRDDIVLWRRNYLKAVAKFREEGRTIYYLDETWVNEDHTKLCDWDDTILSSRQSFLSGLPPGLKNPPGKGKNLIITHIGSESGFVKGAKWVFESKKTGDYHEEINADNFEKWFVNVLPLLDNNCVIVLDNALYHSRRLEKVPTPVWTKQKIKEWLGSKNMEYYEDHLKVELLKFVQESKCRYNSYVIDELSKAQNKTILRLPPYHCELNPLKLIWADCKNYVAANNTTFKMADLKNLFEDSLQQITLEKWNNYVEHVKNKIEKDFWMLDNIMEEMVEPLVLGVDDTSDSDSNLDSE